MINRKAGNVIGNNYAVDNSLAFKGEVTNLFDNYAATNNANIAFDLPMIIRDQHARESLLDTLLESVISASPLTNDYAKKAPFYNNYAERFAQLEDNALRSIAQETALLGYAAIVGYSPFFLKKQWVSCVMKDVLMAEVPDSPVVEYAFERRYIVSASGERYEIPDVFFHPEIMDKLYEEGTGYSIKEDPIALTRFSPRLDILTTEFFPDITPGDPKLELTADIIIFKVIIEVDGKEVEYPCTMKFDVTNKRLIESSIKYTVFDTDGVTVKDTIEDTLYGGMDWKNHTISLYSSTGAIKKVCLRGKLANRWNERALSLARENEQIEFIMPESGLRFNCPITIEDAADAMALQKIDIIADNANVMGEVFAQFQDYDIRKYLKNSFDAQKSALGKNDRFNMGKTIVEYDFDTVPYSGYGYTVTTWQKEVREIVEREVAELKTILKIEDIAVVMVGHPNIIRFIGDDAINWVFNKSAEIGGTKLNYDFGILTSAQDRIHVISTMNIPPQEGIWFLVIPLTNQYITFKHLMFNAVIDRNYRGHVYDKVPNLMSTQRIKTIDVIPVQGRLNIHNTDNFFPNKFERPLVKPDPTKDYQPVTGGSGNAGTGGAGGSGTPGGDTPGTP